MKFVSIIAANKDTSVGVDNSTPLELPEGVQEFVGAEITVKDDGRHGARGGIGSLRHLDWALRVTTFKPRCRHVGEASFEAMSAHLCRAGTPLT